MGQATEKEEEEVVVSSAAHLTPPPPLPPPSLNQQQQQQQRTSISATASALVISACDKAGMEGIDRDRIDAIILRESENTLYMQQQKRRDLKVDERIAVMQQKLRDRQQQQQQQQQQQSTLQGSTSNNQWLHKIEQELQPEVDAILVSRRLRSTCCVVDMDCFYWACELLSKPHLKELPCCVGQSMITTSNYPARKFGVRSGMAGWIADKLVEELSNGRQKLIHVPNNFSLYQEKSKLAKEVFFEFDPNCRSYSLDEAYLDLSAYVAVKLSHKRWDHEQIRQHVRELSSSKDEETNHLMEMSHDFDAMLQTYSSSECLQAASETVALMRAKVSEATGGLTCSAGLAGSFQLAKIASDYHKPDGQKIVGDKLQEDIWPFLRPLSTRKVPGIGRVTQKILEAFGIHTVQQLYDERALVRFLFGPATAKFLLRASLGGFGSSGHEIISDTAEDGDKNSSAIKRKGISKERTFSHGESWPQIYSRLEDIAHKLSLQMEEEGIHARTIALKVKLHTFDVYQRSKTVATGTTLQKGDELFSHAMEMLQELRKGHKGKSFAPRLIGIRCSNFMDTKEVSTLAANQHVMAKFFSSGSTDNTNRDTASPRPDKHFKIPKDSQRQSCKRSAISSFFGAESENHDAAPTDTSCPVSAPGKSPKASPSGQKTATCPICGQSVSGSSGDDLNRALNIHIDSCLNAPAIRQAVREETNECNRKLAKKQLLTEFFFK